MSEILPFAPSSALAPFLGLWYLDPLSVSRDRVVKRLLGAETLKALWALHSMPELTEVIHQSPELQEKYRAVLQYDWRRSMTVTSQAITLTTPETQTVQPEAVVLPILKITTEGKAKVVIHTRSRTRPCQYLFRMKHEWLLVTERLHQVPQVTHRYHRDKADWLP